MAEVEDDLGLLKFVHFALIPGSEILSPVAKNDLSPEKNAKTSDGEQ